eukprot:10767-Heterococcus_DN1.PRE.3
MASHVGESHVRVISDGCNEATLSGLRVERCSAALCLHNTAGDTSMLLACFSTKPMAAFLAANAELKMPTHAIQSIDIASALALAVIAAATALAAAAVLVAVAAAQVAGMLSRHSASSTKSPGDAASSIDSDNKDNSNTIKHNKWLLTSSTKSLGEPSSGPPLFCSSSCASIYLRAPPSHWPPALAITAWVRSFCTSCGSASCSNNT